MGHALVLAMQVYAALGAVVAGWFLIGPIERDPMAAGAYAFRPLLVPGLMLLWPLVLWRLATTPAPARAFRRAHRIIWLWLALLLPALVVGAMALRQNGPTEAPPLRLAPP